MDDSEFQRQLGLSPQDAELAAAIRRVISRWCHTPVSDILPLDRSEDLHRKMKVGLWGWGWDETGFLIMLEDELKTTIDMKDLRLPALVGGRFFTYEAVAPETLGEWLVLAVPVLKRHIQTGDSATSPT